jgi:hypothetical protein
MTLKSTAWAGREDRNKNKIRVATKLNNFQTGKTYQKPRYNVIL